MAAWGEPLRDRVLRRLVQRNEIDLARVAAHDETWAAAVAELRPLYDRFRSTHGKRSKGWREVLRAFLAEHWDDILRILLLLLPLILEQPS